MGSNPIARGVEPDRAVVNEVMIRRPKDELKHRDGSPRFPGRVTRALEVSYSESERRAHDLLDSYVAARVRPDPGSCSPSSEAGSTQHAEPADSKACALIDELTDICRRDERVVVFYVDTQRWLAGRGTRFVRGGS